MPWGYKIFICILMLLVVINGKYCFNNPTKSLAYSNSILSFICWVVFSYGTCKLVETAAWKRIKEFLNIGFGFGGCFAGAMIVGVQLDNYGRIEFSSNSIWLLLGWAVLAVGCAPIWAGCIYKLSNLKKDGEVQLPEGEQKLMSWKIVGILMVSYLLVLLAVWPGFFSYDAEAESYMVFTDKYSAHHPIVHVLLLGWIMKVMYKIIPSYNAGIVAYLLLQMLVISCCFSYMICFLKRIGVRRWIINISLIFLSLFPTVSMFVCCTTKDVYFSGGLTLLTTLLLEIAKDESAFWQDQRKKWLFAIAIMLVLLFRNNGIYAFVVFLPIFVWIFRKCWRKWLPVLIGIFSFYIVLNQGMNAVFDVKPGEKAEMLCVPMQQLARIHNEDKECFTEEDLEVMYTLIPEVILNNYNPKLADNVKVNFMEDNFKANPAK